MSQEYLYDEDYANIFGGALFGLLQQNEGVVVHYRNKGYIVSHTKHEDGEWRIAISRDDDMLQHNNGQLLWLHDESIGTA